MRTCIRCYKKKSDGFFQLIRPKGEATYRLNKCKVCKSAENKERYYKNKTASIVSLSERVCSKCEKLKPSTDFGRTWSNKSGLMNVCLLCIKIYHYKRYRKHTKNGTNILGVLINKFSNTPCMDCDGMFDFCSMDFDHKLGEIKSFNVGSLGAQMATPERMNKVMNEINKCDLICANCHRIRTKQRVEKEYEIMQSCL